MIFALQPKATIHFADSARNAGVQGKTELELTEASVAEDHLYCSVGGYAPFTRGLQSHCLAML
jgi:hypothetical protein